MDLQDLLGKKVKVVTPAALHKKIRDRILGQAIDISLLGSGDKGAYCGKSFSMRLNLPVSRNALTNHF